MTLRLDRSHTCCAGAEGAQEESCVLVYSMQQALMSCHRQLLVCVRLHAVHAVGLSSHSPNRPQAGAGDPAVLEPHQEAAAP